MTSTILDSHDTRVFQDRNLLLRVALLLFRSEGAFCSGDVGVCLHT
jgi:hypothetical protein